MDGRHMALIHFTWSNNPDTLNGCTKSTIRVDAGVEIVDVIQARQILLHIIGTNQSSHGENISLKWSKYVNIQIFTQNWPTIFYLTLRALQNIYKKM